MKKFIGCAVTKDFEDVVNAFDTLCSKKYLDRSRIIREAIRKEVKLLLEEYKDDPEIAIVINKYILLPFSNSQTSIQFLN